MTDVAALARQLHQAQRSVREIDQPDPLELADAYAVQLALLELRYADGERRTGPKLGFTSKAKMTQMGVSEIIAGVLTDAMLIGDGADVDLGRFIHPRIEPEVAFRLGRDVDAANSIVEALDAVAPGLEIIDSRYRDFRFDLASVVADNTSAAGYVLGPWQSLPEELGEREVQLTVDGVVVESGSTSAILGHPLEALRALQDMAARYDIPLRAGDVILAGAATAAASFGAGLVTAQVAGLGPVSVRGVR